MGTTVVQVEQGTGGRFHGRREYRGVSTSGHRGDGTRPDSEAVRGASVGVWTAVGETRGSRPAVAPPPLSPRPPSVAGVGRVVGPVVVALRGRRTGRPAGTQPGPPDQKDRTDLSTITNFRSRGVTTLPSSQTRSFLPSFSSLEVRPVSRNFLSARTPIAKTNREFTDNNLTQYLRTPSRKFSVFHNISLPQKRRGVRVPGGLPGRWGQRTSRTTREGTTAAERHRGSENEKQQRHLPKDTGSKGYGLGLDVLFRIPPERPRVPTSEH